MEASRGLTMQPMLVQTALCRLRGPRLEQASHWGRCKGQSSRCPQSPHPNVQGREGRSAGPVV